MVTELADTAVEEAASQIAGVPIILPFGVVDVFQDLGKLGVKKLAQEGVEEVTESVASKATRAGDAAGAAAAPSSNVGKAVDVLAGARNNAGFSKLIGMGTGAAEAEARAESIRLAELRAAGVTREVAQHWLDFYRNAAATGRGGAAAGARVQLFQQILSLLDGG